MDMAAAKVTLFKQEEKPKKAPAINIARIKGKLQDGDREKYAEKISAADLEFNRMESVDKAFEYITWKDRHPTFALNTLSFVIMGAIPAMGLGLLIGKWVWGA